MIRPSNHHPTAVLARVLLVAAIISSAVSLGACSAVESFGEDVSRLGSGGRDWIADVSGHDPRIDSDY